MVDLILASTAAVGAAAEQEPTAWGLSPGAWVALAMIIVFVIAIVKGVPGIIGRMLDKRIDDIRAQLDNAAALRKEAEALKAEYEKKARDVHKEVEALRVSAERQAQEILDKAKADATDLIARHSAMAEEKIASAERAVLAEIRGKAAEAAAQAARALVAEKHGADADKALVDKTISGLGRPH